MIQLSYSSLSLLHDRPHCWLNKTIGIPQPEKPEWAQGKKIHKIIQAHVSGKKAHPHLKHIKYKFPIVEEVEFDERCRFEIPMAAGMKSGKVEKYKIIGFLDGLDLKNKRFLEIKSSDPVWTLGRFQRSIQRKLYALAKPKFTEAILIACSKNEAIWASEKPKVYKVPLTPQDKSEAVDWIMEGIKILVSGNFTTDLVGGKCLDPRCYWGENCQFK